MVAALRHTNKPPGYFVSAPWRSSGKTLITLGLSGAARRRGLTVQTFKKGPDFIDPQWLGAASGHACFNLDPYLQTTGEIQLTYQTHSANASITLIEGTMGLHDGLAVDGSDSNAAIAKLLKTPVVLVVDCRGMHRTVAALLKGIQEFDEHVVYAGVILNRIRSARHEDKVQKAIAEYTDLTLLGSIADSVALQVDEKELGLVPIAQLSPSVSEGLINSVVSRLEAGCDLDRLFPSVQIAPESKGSCQRTFDAPVICDYTVGIARDAAFHFYYEDDLQALAARGVRLVEFSPLTDELPENLDGLLLGGGFPERYAAQLAANEGIRGQLYNAIAQGLPVRAECAGLMYLCRSLNLQSGIYPMVGAIPGAVSMCEKPQGRGYVQLSNRNGTACWHAHEFHHSEIDFDNPPSFAYRVKRGHGVDGENDGVCVHNVLASYAHFRHTAATPWVDWFIDQLKVSRDAPRDSQRVMQHV